MIWSAFTSPNAFLTLLGNPTSFQQNTHLDTGHVRIVVYRLYGWLRTQVLSDMLRDFGVVADRQ